MCTHLCVLWTQPIHLSACAYINIIYFYVHHPRLGPHAQKLNTIFPVFENMVKIFNPHDDRADTYPAMLCLKTISCRIHARIIYWFIITYSTSPSCHPPCGLSKRRVACTRELFEHIIITLLVWNVEKIIFYEWLTDGSKML